MHLWMRRLVARGGSLAAVARHGHQGFRFLAVLMVALMATQRGGGERDGGSIRRFNPPVDASRRRLAGRTEFGPASGARPILGGHADR